jgi:hypothetical protein
VANHVTLASVAPPPCTNLGAAEHDAVECMIRHWGDQLQPVLPDQPDLILLPEVCDTYPSHTPDERRTYLAKRANRIRDFFCSVARKQNCYIGYASLRQADDGTWRNSLQLIDRRGTVTGTYDKNHLTIWEHESRIARGNTAPIFKCDFGTVACTICFDLNFDVLRDQYRKQRPDLILFSSMYHGGLMFNYWAYSCRAHMLSSVAGLPSQLLSPLGHPLASTTNYRNYVVAKVNLDSRIAHIDFNEEKFLAMKQKYGREVTVFDPGFLGSVLITSESNDRTPDDLLKEFAIEPLDDYLDRSFRLTR